VNPYKIYGSKINHVFVGISNLDYRFLQIASKCFPDHLFHVIGPHRDVIKGQNIIYHGYLKYEETIGFIKFANVGLQIRSNENSIAYSLSDSLKVLQYSYCKLPVICPAVMKEYSHRRNLFYYEYDNPSSIADCIDQAVKFDRASFSNSDILNWNQVARKLIARTK